MGHSAYSKYCDAYKLFEKNRKKLKEKIEVNLRILQ